MRIVRSIDAYEADADLLLTIGVFDGVHIGHREVLAKLVARRTPSTLAGALTFELIRSVFCARSSHPSLSPRLKRRSICSRAPVSTCCSCCRSTNASLGIPAREFLTDILLDRLHTRELVVGSEWRFGKGARRRRPPCARRALGSKGCAFEAAPLLERDGEKVSSSRIRSLIAERRFEQADALLGSPYVVRGTGHDR